MTIQQLWTPVKRELWEHKTGILWVPAVVMLLLVLAVFYLAIIYGYSSSDIAQNFSSNGNEHYSLAMKSHTEVMHFKKNLTEEFMLIFVAVSTVLMWLPLSIVLMIYAHGTLFDDRKNREILFWRSMPVSETQNVLTKLAIIVLVVPTIVFALTLVGVVSVALIEAISLLVGRGAQPEIGKTLVGCWLAVKSYGMVLYGGIVLLPLFSWMIFSSALAKKSPFMVSSLVPIFLIVLDKLALRFLSVDLHIVAAFDRYWALLGALDPGGDMVFNPALAPSFFVAMLVSGLLVLATIWLRNNRYEI